VVKAPFDKSARTFRDILLLLFAQGELNEDLLELLIDKVDAELLKAVVLENLESVNVQHADDRGRILVEDGFIDLRDDPLEEARVDAHRKGVAGKCGLGRREGGLDGLADSLDGTRGQRRDKITGSDLQKLCSMAKRRVVIDDSLVVCAADFLVCDGEIAKMEDGRQ
jgi:hypothetical protein